MHQRRVLGALHYWEGIMREFRFLLYPSQVTLIEDTIEVLKEYHKLHEEGGTDGQGDTASPGEVLEGSH